MDHKEKLSQIADLVCHPEKNILEFYDNFTKQISEEEAFKVCKDLLQIWHKHYAPMMEKLRSMGVLKKVNYETI